MIIEIDIFSDIVGINKMNIRRFMDEIVWIMKYFIMLSILNVLLSINIMGIKKNKFSSNPNHKIIQEFEVIEIKVLEINIIVNISLVKLKIILKKRFNFIYEI